MNSFLSFIPFVFIIGCSSLLPAQKTMKWSGKYVRTDHRYELYIEQWDVDGIDCTIVEPGKDPKQEANQVFDISADVKGWKARWVFDPECKVEFERLADGVEVTRICDDRLSGFYRVEE